MENLPIHTVSTNYVNYSDLEKFIQHHYSNHDYSFVADQECGNDSCAEFDVTGEVDSWEEQDLAEFKKGGSKGFITGAILNDLARQGKIPAGSYIIRVCW